MTDSNSYGMHSRCQLHIYSDAYIIEITQQADMSYVRDTSMFQLFTGFLAYRSPEKHYHPTVLPMPQVGISKQMVSRKTEAVGLGVCSVIIPHFCPVHPLPDSKLQPQQKNKQMPGYWKTKGTPNKQKSKKGSYFWGEMRCPMATYACAGPTREW